MQFVVPALRKRLDSSKSRLPYVATQARASLYIKAPFSSVTSVDLAPFTTNMVRFRHDLLRDGSGISWTILNSFTFDQEPTRRSDEIFTIAFGRQVVEERDDTEHEAKINFDFDHEIVRYNNNDHGVLKYLTKAPPQQLPPVDLSMSFYYQGSYHALKLTTKGPKLSGKPAAHKLECIWDYDRTSSEMRRLLSAIAQDDVLMHVAVSGYCEEADAQVSGQGRPAAADTSHLSSLYTLSRRPPAQISFILHLRCPLMTPGSCERTSRLCATPAATSGRSYSPVSPKHPLSSAMPRPSSTSGNHVQKQDSRELRNSDDAKTLTIKIEHRLRPASNCIALHLYRRSCLSERSTSQAIDMEHSWCSEDDDACDRDWSPASAGCTSWWRTKLRPANAFDMYRIADKYCIDGLREAALDISRKIPHCPGSRRTWKSEKRSSCFPGCRRSTSTLP